MDKKNIIIGVLIIALAISLYFTFQNQADREISDPNSQTANLLAPSTELKAAFIESSQHSAMADIAELSCLPDTRYDCSSEGCTQVTPATYYFVDYGSQSGTYFRCDTKGCDQYPVKVVVSGSYTQFIPVLGQAMLFKVNNDDFMGTKGEFIDMVTLGTGTIVSFGKCSVAK